MGTQYVLQTTPEDEASGRSRRVLEAILRSCRQMERLVRDFADLSEIEGNAVDLRCGVHDAANVLSMAAERLRGEAVARGVDIELALPQGSPLHVRCDHDRLLRALGHLLDNAVRFAPQGTAVELAVEVDERVVRFSVTDRGPGLSKDTLENLYDRAWHGRRAERVGAGLGLAIVRGVADAHGGEVEVSTVPGTTRFSLLIPRDAPG